MSTKRSPARDGGATVGYDNYEHSLDSKSDTTWQQAVVIRPGADNGRWYGGPVVSSRLRFIGTLGFRRRRRWLAPFSTAVFGLERGLLATAPLIGGQR
jgi:hypothetical protein